ncbi:MAG: ATPase [Treponema sp.]|jgi:hypothetical protein|nr:ATPase [Treponema sp.]
MEELQSTELLDREILEDARKKAYRILKSADEAVKAGDAAWERKTDAAIAGLRQNYAEDFEKTKQEIRARLILDKRRIRVEKIEGLLGEAMDAYFHGLPRETLLSLLTGELQRLEAEVREAGEPVSGFRVQCGGLSDEEAAGLLTASFPPGTWTQEKAAAGTGREARFPWVEADAPLVRITASITELGKTLLQDKRAELVEALLGPAAIMPEGAL